MKTIKSNFLVAVAILTWLLISAVIIQSAVAQSGRDSSIDKGLFSELMGKDSAIFDAAFNTCRIGDVESVLNDNFEFYPDNGGSTYISFQTRSEFLDGIKSNFCDPAHGSAMKMKRVIEPGSLQLFPLAPEVVLQCGIQKFYVLSADHEEKLVEVSKFTRTWKKNNGTWKLSKEFDSFANTYAAHPQDSLYNVIQLQDSLLFAAYNDHDLNKIKTFFTSDLEFYHDKGGLTNYIQNMEGFKSNFEKNNGIRRELVPGSLEVYPVKEFGAMEIGEHKFCHAENGKQDCGTFKFAMVWKKTPEGWKISRVLSYGH
jgi:hypothetical protein